MVEPVIKRCMLFVLWHAFTVICTRFLVPDYSLHHCSSLLFDIFKAKSLFSSHLNIVKVSFLQEKENRQNGWQIQVEIKADNSL